MKNHNYFLKSLINAVCVFVYVAGVAWIGFNSQNIFGPQRSSFLDPLFVILLFVISAAITGLLVLGKPILLYLDNHKKEAFTMLFATLAWLVIFLFVVVLGLFFF
ncbi:MAG: hypothetical protein KGJ89_01975 [Patescibacteria group bacterium]|nr:hypothetical protein [Patescibacteria group bacterium]MDE2015644.1 hypothetical protein [Patescibacteria group bacterium]MDE2226701.1 hypothetical protein [Patescibacteria group bacterium]